MCEIARERARSVEWDEEIKNEFPLDLTEHTAREMSCCAMIKKGDKEQEEQAAKKRILQKIILWFIWLFHFHFIFIWLQEQSSANGDDNDEQTEMRVFQLASTASRLLPATAHSSS